MVKKIKILFFTIGIILFMYLIYKIGIEKIHKDIISMGYKFPLIFLPCVLIFYFDTLGWQYSFGKFLHGMRMSVLYPVRWAGEAINVITPTASLGGEPVKAYLLNQYGVPMRDGLASVVVSKTIMVMAQILFIIIGSVVAVYYLSPARLFTLSLAAIIITSIVVVFSLYLWQKKGLFTSVINLLERFKIRVPYLMRNREKVESLDRKIRYFYNHQRKRFCISFLYYFLSWASGVLEVYVILVLMGNKIGLAQALIVETTIQSIKSFVFFIPGGLGVLEGGGILIFSALGFGPETGLSYSIFRRVRELGWAGVGFIILIIYSNKQAKIDNDRLF